MDSKLSLGFISQGVCEVQNSAIATHGDQHEEVIKSICCTMLEDGQDLFRQSGIYSIANIRYATGEIYSQDFRCLVIILPEGT